MGGGQESCGAEKEFAEAPCALSYLLLMARLAGSSVCMYMCSDHDMYMCSEHDLCNEHKAQRSRMLAV